MSTAAGKLEGQEAPMLDRIRAWTGSNTLVPLLFAGAAFIALLAALVLWAGAPTYRVLFSNLAEADGGRIISELESRGVPYRFSEGGQAIMVPSEQVHLLRLQLAEQGLPQGGNVGFELMDNQAFGISQFTEQVNFQRGLEGELSRTMESLGPVSRARLHLAMAKSSVFIRDREPAKASVVLTLQPGRSLGEGQVSAIRHLVSSAVPDLPLEQVTVVDQNGNLLSRQQDNQGADATRLEYIQEVESSYQQRIENILSPLFGKRNFQVQVAAQIDFSSREETAERYGPNQPPNEAAVRSAQISSTFNGRDLQTGGVPGALSNTPPGLVPSPIAPPQDGVEAAVAAETPEQLSFDNLVNYEVDRNIIHIQHQRGQIERLSVAVVVNYRDGTDEEGNPIRVALSETELEQVDRLARQAMGYSEQRGDALEVVNSPFTELEVDAEPETIWWQEPLLLELLLQLGRFLVAALLGLFLYRQIVAPLLARHLASRPATAVGPSATAPNPQRTEEEDSDIAMDSGAYQREVAARIRPRRAKTLPYESSLQGVRKMAQEDPRMVAMVVRNWIGRNNNG